jgi:Gpi18-like mannosyltransferase
LRPSHRSTASGAPAYLVQSFSGYLLSAAELCTLLLLRQLVQEEIGEAAGQRAVFFLVWAPFSVYLAAAYAEWLFLLLSIGVFWMLRRGDRLGAGALVALAVLTRP